MPRVCSISRLSLIALLLAAFGSVAWAKPKVAILGLEVSNSGVVDPKDAGNAAKLTEELRRNPGRFDLAPNSNRELQDEKVMGNCDTEKPSCMAPIGSGLSAEFLVYGRIEKASEKGKGDGYKVLVKLLNVKDRKVEESWEGFVPLSQIGSGSLRDWSQKVNARLAGEKPPLIPERVEKGPGKLVLKIGNTKTGKVSIDGAKKGELEDGTITLSLSEGAHRLEIEAPDRKPYEDTIVITSGQTKTVDVELEETVGPTPPPLPPVTRGGGGWRALMWGAIAVGGASTAFWAYGFTEIRDAEFKLCSGAHSDRVDFECEDPTKITAMNFANKTAEEIETRKAAAEMALPGLVKRGDDWTKRVNFIAIPITAVAGAAAIVGFVKGYVLVGSKGKERSAMGGRTRRELTVTPVISPDGGGATIRFDW